MRFDCGETEFEKTYRLINWHSWFAWRPVKLDDHDCRWLECVARRGEQKSSWHETWWEWSYRPLPINIWGTNGQDETTKKNCAEKAQS
jgi:hypothetical protein